MRFNLALVRGVSETPLDYANPILGRELRTLQTPVTGVPDDLNGLLSGPGLSFMWSTQRSITRYVRLPVLGRWRMMHRE